MSKNIKKTRNFALSTAAAMLLVGGIAQGATYNQGDKFTSSTGLLHDNFDTNITVKSLSDGSIDIAQDSNTHELNITMNKASESALLEWNSFDIDKGATVNFDGTDASNPSIYVNKLDSSGDDTNGAQIDGTINGINNPTVVIMDPNGVSFGADAQVTNISNFMVTTGDLPNINTAEDFNGTKNILDNVYDSNPAAGTITIDGNLAINDYNTSAGYEGHVRLAADNIQGVNGIISSDTIHITVRNDSEINTSVNNINLSSVGAGLTINNDKNATLLDTIADNMSNLVINTDGNTLTVGAISTHNSDTANLKSDSNITFSKKIDDDKLNINVATTQANKTIKIDENVTANSLNITTDNLALDGNVTTNNNILILTTSDDTNITLGGTANDSDNNLVLTNDEIANVKSNIQFGNADKRVNSLSLADNTNLSNSDVTIYTKGIEGTGKELDTKDLYIDTNGNIGQDQATADSTKMFTINSTGAVTILADQNVSLHSTGDLNISTIQAADTVSIKSDGNIVDAGGDSNISANRLYLDVASAKYVGTIDNTLTLKGVSQAIEVKDNNLSGFHIDSDKDIELFHDLNVTNTNNTGVSLISSGKIITDVNHSGDVDLAGESGEENQTIMSASNVTLTATDFNLAIDTTNKTIQANGTITLNDTEGDLLLNADKEGDNNITQNLIDSIDNNNNLIITSAGKMTLDGNGTFNVSNFTTTTLKATDNIDLAGQDNDDQIVANNLVLDGANITANDQTNVRIKTIGDLTLKGASIASATKELNVTVEYGSLEVNATKGAGDVKLYANDPLTITTLDANDGDSINIEGNNSMRIIKSFNTEANLNIKAAKSITTESAITAKAVSLDANGITINDDFNTTTMNLNANTSALTVQDGKTLIAREGNMSLTATSILDNVENDINVLVSNGNLNIDATKASGDVNVTSTQDLSLGSVKATNSDLVFITTNGNLKAAGDISTDSNLTLNAGSDVTLNNVTAQSLDVNATNKLVVNDGNVLKSTAGNIDLLAGSSIANENNGDVQVSVNGGALSAKTTGKEGNIVISSTDDKLTITQLEANNSIKLNVKDVNFTTNDVKAGAIDITAGVLGYKTNIEANVSDLNIKANKIIADNASLSAVKEMNLTAGEINTPVTTNKLFIDSSAAGDVTITGNSDLNITGLSNAEGDKAIINATGNTLTIGKAIDDEGKESLIANTINIDANLKANTIDLTSQNSKDIKTNNGAAITTTEGNLTINSANAIDVKANVADYLNVKADSTVDVSSDNDLRIGDVNDNSKNRTFTSNGDITFTKDIKLTGDNVELSATAKNIVVDSNITSDIVKLNATDSEGSITGGDNGVVTGNTIDLTGHIIGSSDKNLRVDLDHSTHSNDDKNVTLTLNVGQITDTSEVNVTQINKNVDLEVKTEATDETNNTVNNLVFNRISSPDLASNSNWKDDIKNDLTLDYKTLNAVPTLLTLDDVYTQVLTNKDAIDALTNRVDDLETNVSTINSELGTGFNSDNTVAKYIAQLATGTQTLPALSDMPTLTNYATTEALDNVVAIANTNTDNIAKIATINGDTVALTSAVDASNAKANDEALGDLKNKVDTLEENVTNVNNNVDSISNNESTLTKIYNFFSGLFK